MLVEIILYVFAIIYYVFSTLAFAEYMSDKHISSLKAVFLTFITMIVAPIFVPIVAGIKVGLWMKGE